MKVETTLSNPALNTLPKILSKPHSIKNGTLSIMVQSTNFASSIANSHGKKSPLSL